MQSLISKSIISRLSNRVIFNRGLLGALQMASSSIGSNSGQTQCLINKSASSYSSDVQFEKITSYETLISRISNSERINDLLNTANQNFLLLKNEHIVLCLRVLARQSRQLNYDESNSLLTDERYIQLTRKAEQIIPELNEYECLDFLFWIRRFKNRRLPLHIKDTGLQQLYDKISEFIKQQAFNFRNLSNIYFDFTNLSRPTDSIAAEILRELKADIKLLTPFTALQLLQSCSIAQRSQGYQQYLLAEFVSRNLTIILEEIDLEQKTQLFKSLAKIEFHLNPPRFRTPSTLYTIKKQLLEKIDQLNETGASNILQAYEDIPREFSNDLLEEIKEMVVVTIQHNSSNIKSSFLVEFLEKSAKLKRYRRLNEEKMNIIYAEVARRLPGDDYLQRSRNLEKVCETYIIHQLNEKSFLEALQKTIKSNEKLQNQFQFLQFLQRKGVNLEEFIDNLVSNDQFIANLKQYQAVKLYLLVSSANENGKYQELIKELEANVYQNKSELYKLIPILSTYRMQSDKRRTLLKEAIASLQAKKDEFEIKPFYKYILQTIESQEVKNIWIEYLSNEIPQYSTEAGYRLFEAFEELEQYNQLQFVFLLFVLEKLQPQSYPIKKILNTLRNNRLFVNELTRNEQVTNQFIQLLKNNTTNSEVDIKLQQYQSIYQILESSGYRGRNNGFLLKAAYQKSLKQQVKPAYQIEAIVQEKLLSNNLLDPSLGLDFYNRRKGTNYEQNLMTRLLFYVINRKPQLLEQSDIEQDVQQKISQLESYFSDPNQKVVIESVALLLSLPHKLIQEKKDYYLRTLKDYINLGYSQQYMTLIGSLEQTHVEGHYEFYMPFIKEIVNNYPNYSKKLQTQDIVNILRKFSYLKLRNPTIYNHVLADLSRVFNYLTNEEKIQVINSFARVQIKHPELFEKISNKIFQNITQFRPYLEQVFQGFYAIGLDNDFIRTKVEQNFDRLLNLGYNSAASLLTYLPILNISNEESLIAQIINRLSSSDKTHKNYNRISDFFIFAQYVYKNNTELTNSINNFKLSLSLNQEGTHNSNLKKNHAGIVNKVGNYLTAMNLSFQTDYQIDGFPIDIYIQEKQTIIKVLPHYLINFDKESLTGRGLYIKRIYQSFTDYKTVIINYNDLQNQPDHMSRVNFLIALGVENNNTSGIFDFSNIKGSESEEVSEIHEEESIVNEEIETEEVSELISPNELEFEIDEKLGKQ